MSTIKERLAAAKLPERSLQVCLRGDLAAEFDDLERQLQTARQAEGSRRLNAGGEAAKIAEKMKALQEQMAGEMLSIRVRALPRTDTKDPETGEKVEGWRTLVLRHPPKKDDKGDEALGVDLAGLMSEAMPRCVVEPELDAEDWDRLNAVLNAADYDRLLSAVWEVNRSGVDVPKSPLASLVMRQAGDDSK